MRLFDQRIPVLETGAAWLLAFLWLSPLAYAFWAAFHPAALATLAIVQFQLVERRVHYR